MKVRCFSVAAIALASLALAGVASASSAGQPTACKLITASEFKQVLGKTPSKFSPSEGSSTCFVTGGGVNVGLQLGAYQAAQVKQWLSLPNVQKVPSLGPNAFSMYRANYGISVYATKGTRLITVTGKSLSKAQAVKLASLALKRL